METETSKPAPDTEPTAAPAEVAKARRPARTKAAKPAAEKKAAKLPGKAAPAQAALKAAPAKRPARKKPAAPAPEAKAAAPTAARKAAPAKRAATPHKHHEETTRHDPKTVIESILSLGTSLLRVNRGVVVQGHRAKPAKLLELYEAEYCPFCRHVREALTELDLDAHIYPMPKGGKRYRDQLVKLGGKAKVPFLHDPNTGTKLYESEAIADYLYKQYGIEGIDVPERRVWTSALATATRGKLGMFAAPSKPAKKPLELWSFEASPYSRLVREVFCELEISYVLHNVGKSPGAYAEFFPPILRHNLMLNYMPATENRQNLIKRGGKMMVPYIEDPNTGISMYETKEIKAYLRKTYGA